MPSHPSCVYLELPSLYTHEFNSLQNKKNKTNPIVGQNLSRKQSPNPQQTVLFFFLKEEAESPVAALQFTDFFQTNPSGRKDRGWFYGITLISAI